MDEINLTWYDMRKICALLKTQGYEYLYQKIDGFMEENDKAELFTVYVKE